MANDLRTCVKCCKLLSMKFGPCEDGGYHEWGKPEPITDGIVMALSIDGLQLGNDELLAMGRAMIDLIRYHQQKVGQVVVTCRSSNLPCARCKQRDGERCHESQG
jgi:hypothetical protein